MSPSPPIIIEDDEEEGNRGTTATNGQQAPTGPQISTEANDCIICYEPYSEGDGHKPAVLKCGHHAGESCMKKWLRSSKFCPTCRKPARPRDLVPVFNLPTVVVAASNAVPAASAAAAAGANPTELAQKEMMLQKVQRAYSVADKEAKRLRTELESTQRKMAAMLEAHQQQTAAAEKAQHAQRLTQTHPQQHLVIHSHGMPPPIQQHRFAPGSGWPRPHAFDVSPAQPNGNHHGHSSSSAVQPPPHHCVRMQSPHPAGTAAAAPWHSGPAGGSYYGSGGVQQQPPGGPIGAPSGPQYAATMPPMGAGGAGASTQWAPTGSTLPGYASGFGGGGGQMAPLPQHPGQPPVLDSSSSSIAGSMWGNFTSGACQYDGTRGMYGALPQQQRQAAGLAFPPPPGALAGTAGGGAVGGGGLRDFEQMFGVAVEGCRLLAVDVAGSRVLVSENPGGNACIRKISMLAPESFTRIRLPVNAGIIYDMQLPTERLTLGSSSSASWLAAVVTRGSGLCLVCPRSDSVVASFSGLPHRPWSCSWVPEAPSPPQGAGAASGPYGEHLLVAGLEKGHLALLDTRRTDRPVAVLAALQHAPRGCAQLPVRAVAALPSVLASMGVALPVVGVEGQLQLQQPPVEGAADGGVLWPTCVLSCTRGAWLLRSGGGSCDAAAALLPLDGGFGAGGMQIESTSVFHQVGAAAASGGQPWRVALSWRPADGAAATAPQGPRHEIGILRTDEQAPYKHEVTVADYTRRGIEAVRSCLLPPHTAPPPQPHNQLADSHRGQGQAEPDSAMLLASSDGDSCQPLIWSLRGGGGGGGDGGAQVVQWLAPHPEPPVCLVAATSPGGGGDCFLGCGSQSRVTLYRRRAG